MGRNEYAQARKQYVEEARRSFGHAQEDDYSMGAADTESAGFSFFKVRLLLAACIFAAFVLCDRTGSRFYNYTTDEVITMLQEERFQTQLDSIREAWSAITKQPRNEKGG